METSIRDAFVGRKHLVSIFVNLEKAYDTIWKHGILLDLYKTGLRGRLPMFICDILSDRHFIVRVGNIILCSLLPGGLKRRTKYIVQRKRTNLDWKENVRPFANFVCSVDEV